MSDAAQVGSTTLVPVVPGRAITPLFKNRNFLLLWLAYVISALGDRIHFLVMLSLLEIMKNTGLQKFLADGTRNPDWRSIGTQETAQLNILMLAPFLLFGPITGVIADRLPRRFILITADFARSAIVLLARTLLLAIPANSVLNQSSTLIPVLSYAQILLFSSEFSLAIFSAFFSPARTALMPNLVHSTQLLRANSLTNAAGTVASLVGFLVGAALINWHLEVAMYVDAATFLVSGILLFGMTTKHIPAQSIGRQQTPGFIREFAGGLRYLFQHKRAVQIIGLMFLFWCCGAIILSGLTGVVTNKFHKPVEWFGIFLGLVGIGMMLGAASCSLARRGIPKEFGVAWSMTLVGVFFFLFSIPDRWPLALIFLMICAFFGAILLVSLDTMLQRIVPDFVRGRLMAMRDMMANVGLVGVQIPLAINPDIDRHVVVVLRVLAVLVMIVGVMLIIYYYRRQVMPLPAAIGRRIVVFYLAIFKRFAVGNAGRIPAKGPVIFVSNHTTGYDPLCLQAASKHRLIQFMMAKEYYEKPYLKFFLKWIKVIPVNRSGNDTASIRTAIRALNDGACIGMFPEGGISDDGRLLEGKQGVALLALMSGATVVPSYIVGTSAYKSMFGDFFRFNTVTLYFGRPIKFDDLGGKKDEGAREVATKRIMDEIRRLRDKYETNPERRMSSAEWNAVHGVAKEKAQPSAAGAG